MRRRQHNRQEDARRDMYLNWRRTGTNGSQPAPAPAMAAAR
jgi:hypothetical protein